jgi:hypothetical protein
VDKLHEDTLVLEDVTLGLLVERVVPSTGISPTLGHRAPNSQMLIDLSCLPVLSQQPPKNPLPAHPEHLGGHTRLGRTFPLSSTGVAALALGGEQIAGAGARVDRRRLDDHTAVLDEFLDARARVGAGDFGCLGGVEPDLALADAGDRGGEALLGAKVGHIGV